MTNPYYSSLLHDSAAWWGLPMQPDRPLIDDDTDPYPQPSVVETLAWRGPTPWRWAEIQIVTLNAQWSFCVSVWDTGSGGGYGPWRKFCRPYPTRSAALAAAAAYIQRHWRPSRELTAWLHELIKPIQLSLF